MIVSMIVAMTPDMIIGKDSHLPWHIPSDLKRFKRITSGHHVLMGRVNYEDIGRPLPNRINLILTRDATFKAEGCITVATIEDAIRIAKGAGETEFFVIGGASAYRVAMPYADKLYLTIVCAIVDGTVNSPRECWRTDWVQVGDEVHNTWFDAPSHDDNSEDDYDTIYCMFIKKEYRDKVGPSMCCLEEHTPTHTRREFMSHGELNARYEQLQSVLKNFIARQHADTEAILNLNDEVFNLEKELRHQKYKRCLAMVELFNHVLPITRSKSKWCDKWQRRWFELAEHYKEVK